jgi:hypothetical protein
MANQIQQSQESTLDQLYQAVDVVNKAGLYDAADFIKRQIELVEKKNIWGFHPEFNRKVEGNKHA